MPLGVTAPGGRSRPNGLTRNRFRLGEELSISTNPGALQFVRSRTPIVTALYEQAFEWQQRQRCLSAVQLSQSRKPHPQTRASRKLVQPGRDRARKYPKLVRAKAQAQAERLCRPLTLPRKNRRAKRMTRNRVERSSNSTGWPPTERRDYPKRRSFLLRMLAPPLSCITPTRLRPIAPRHRSHFQERL
jgi:hypothetical protein